MSGLQGDLALVWYLLLSLVLLLVFWLDGLDLGVGVLSLFLREEKERGLAMDSIMSVWHANQTWLVVLGSLLFGAFPLLYGLVLSAFYLPVALMLLGFILRGVSLEYYARAENRRAWSLAFGLGSLAAALAQGFILGGLLKGMPMASVEGPVGGAWQWLSAFGLMATLTVLGAFVLAGATWLALKTSGGLQEKAYRAARAAAFFFLMAGIVLVIWSTSLHPFLTRRWLAWPGAAYTLLPLLLSGAAFLGLLVSLARRRDTAGFLCASLMIVLSLAAFAGSLYPVMLPPGVTVYRAAAAPINLEFMLWGVGIFLPLMLVYNGYQYWVFRGKIADGADGEGY